ncbi:MAG: potassium transporter KtrB [Lachnospiraceae bacterium]|nr:potassium transporter KtrB [Lachnospiraceae bacterium]
MFRRKETVRYNTMAILALGFLALIVLGGVLLWIPACNEQPLEFFDALFTSVSAVCVTGLMTITPAVQFTLLGKIILLILIQVGGLGIISCAAAVSFLVRREIHLRGKMMLQETYNMGQSRGILVMLRRVLIATGVMEGIGAVFYAIRFVPMFGAAKGIGYGVFHSISAFCNAGIDILGNSSLTAYHTDAVINVTTMLLIIFGGLGFTVWFDLTGNTRKVFRREQPKGWLFTRLTLHTKLVLVMTVILILVGAGLVFLMEFENPDTIGTMPLGQKVMASFFHSVSTRTAGFYTFDMGGMHEETKFVSCILMFIGGSPGGTAGGIKTTTFAMLILTCITVIRGGKDTECFGRKITFANFRTGFAVFMVSLGAFVVGVLLLSMFEPDQILFINILYEAASAVGTVGLSADLTPQLTRISQIVLMVLMYMGRLGPITLALLFAGKNNARDKIRQLPDEDIIVG